MRYRHRGTSLIEMVLVISVLGIAMALLGNIAYGLFRVDQQARARLLDARQLARLSMQVREDVHRALAVREQSVDRVVLGLPEDRQILYTIRGDRIERHVHQGESLVHRDTFRFSPDLEADWEPGEEDVEQALRLCIRRRPRAEAATDDQPIAPARSRLIRRIEAVPGLDYAALPRTESQTQEEVQ